MENQFLRNHDTFIINSIEAARNVLINSYALLFMLERGTLSYNRLDYYVDNLSTVFHKTVSYLRGPSEEVFFSDQITGEELNEKSKKGGNGNCLCELKTNKMK